MAEGLAQALFGEKVVVQSAGSRPASGVNPIAIQVMAEKGINISSHYPKSVDTINFRDIDLVVTLCADEVCPPLPPKVKHLHWPIVDPGAAEGTAGEIIERFRSARDDIERRLREIVENRR